MKTEGSAIVSAGPNRSWWVRGILWSAIGEVWRILYASWREVWYEATTGISWVEIHKSLLIWKLDRYLGR